MMKTKNRKQKKITPREKETLRIILLSILMNKDYQKHYKKYIEAKNEGNQKAVTKWFWKIVIKWDIHEPIDPSVNVKKVSPDVLKTYFRRGAVLLKMKGHKQLKGEDKIPHIVDISIDLRETKTKIVRETENYIKKIQPLFNEQEKARQKKDDNKNDMLNYSLKDFEVYEKCNALKKKNGRIPFHKIARSNLGKFAISVEVDSEAKKLKRNFNRAKCLINGGYEMLIKKL